MNYQVDKPQAVLITGKACFPEGVALTGTVSSSGLLVTGTGTKFLTELFGAPTNVFPFATTDQGNWNASTNSPALVGSVGTEGYSYTVSVAGNTDLDGNFSWAVGDIIAFYHGKWIRQSKYDRQQPLLYKYLWSKVQNNLREIANVMSDTTLLLKVAPDSALSAEALFVAGRTPEVKSISLSALGAGAILGCIDQADITMDADTIVTFEDGNGLKPICVDGTTGNIQIATQI